MTDCTDSCDLAELCSRRHWSIYWLIIAASVLVVFGRILTAGLHLGTDAETPFYSANDRSRWATIRSLGDEGRYEIDYVIEDRKRINWNTIDKVQHVGTDGELHFYSSKPTLLPTLISYIYRGIKLVTDWELETETSTLARLILMLVNGVPWLLYLWLLGKILETVEINDWARYFIVAVAGFGTFLSTFAVTLNNHLPAAVCVAATLYCLVRIVNYQDRSWRMFALAGLTAAFAAANELPALSFLVAVSVVCAFKSPSQFLIGFLPAAALVVAGFFGTNYLAHNEWRPPYAYRSDGPVVATVSGDFTDTLNDGRLPPEFVEQLNDRNLTEPRVSAANWPFTDDPAGQIRWRVSDLERNVCTILGNESNNDFQIRAWNNWYDYEGTYWTSDKKSDVDLGQPDSTLYLFHILFGHHGIFSLTPIWLLSLAGMIVLLFRPQLKLRWLAFGALSISIVVIAFYAFKVPGHDRNYGGFTSGFRWAFWLAPLWLISMAPIADWLGKTRSGRAVCLLLLVLSGLSAWYSASNPWVHPWLYEIWDLTGLPK